MVHKPLYFILITRTGRHRVIKWALFFLVLPILHFDTMTRSLLSLDHVLGKVHGQSDVCFACLAWFYQLFVRMIISLTNAQAGCGRPTLNFIERIDLGSSKGCSVPTAKPLHLVTYVQNVDQFSMNMNLKMFCTFFLSYIFLPFSVLFYATQIKRQKI